MSATGIDLVQRQREDLAALVAPLSGQDGRPDKELVDLCYQHYNRGHEGMGSQLASVQDLSAPRLFTHALAQATDSRWSWHPDYKLVAKSGSKVKVEGVKGETVEVESILFDGPDKDGQGRLLQTPVRASSSDPWVYFFGEDGPRQKVPVVRCYWAILPSGAALLVATLTKELNRNRVPFSFKVLRDAARFGRADGGVLYLPEYAWARTYPLLARIHAQVAHVLADLTPRLTRPLAKGLAVAKDSDGESFGMTRCTAIVNAYRANGNSPDVPSIESRLGSAGLQPGKYHLRPGEDHDLEWSMQS